MAGNYIFTGGGLLLIALALVLCGCQGRGISPPAPVLGEPFILGVGESATIIGEDLTLTFVEVLHDLRCPTRVICEAEGPVEITVTLQSQGGEAARYTMNPEPVRESFGWAPHQVSNGEYLVELISVDPYPEKSEDGIDFDDYQATFVIKLEE